MSAAYARIPLTGTPPVLHSALAELRAAQLAEAFGAPRLAPGCDDAFQAPAAIQDSDEETLLAVFSEPQQGRELYQSGRPDLNRRPPEPH